MQICLNCKRGIKNEYTQCPKCQTSDLMDKQEFNKLFDLYNRANHTKRQELLYNDKRYNLIIKYCFPKDENINPHKPRNAKNNWIKTHSYLSQIKDKKISTTIIQSTTIDNLPNIPHCPICNSTNLSKITLAKKATKIALFGVFGMGDNSKTWKCNNCGSKF